MQHIKILIEKLEKINTERHEKYFSWIKTILTIVAGLVAVLVSLKTKKSETETAHLFFTVTIVLLSTCILTGLFLLYEEVTSLDDQQTSLREHILKSLHHLAVPYTYYHPNIASRRSPRAFQAYPFLQSVQCGTKSTSI